MRQIIDSALKESAAALAALRSDDSVLQRLEEAAKMLSACFENKGHVYSCGNGGSMCDAMHFAEELSGKFREDRPALGAAAISDPSFLTCTGNDYGYEHVFSRYIEAHGREGDVLLAISTSGTSKNVLLAAKTAKRLGLKVISLTGRPTTALGELANIDLCTAGGSQFADRVQELHIKCIHILIELVENALFKKS